MSGEDALDLLNRLSTNDLGGLERGETRNTLLTTSQGKLLDWVRVTRMDESELRLLGSPGRASKVAEWLETYTIMEDAVTRVVSETRPAWRCRVSDLDGLNEGLDAIPAPKGFGTAWDVLRDPLPKRLLSPTSLNELEYEAARVRAGVPSAEHEFATPVNPLELRLGPPAVSFSKGCYVGQEVLSRLDSYDKVARLLTGWRSRDAVRVDDSSRIVSGGKVLGRITSFVSKENRGLAVLKRGSAGHATLQTGDEQWEVELLDLPFWNET